jgi:hypothetical protein
MARLFSPINRSYMFGCRLSVSLQFYSRFMRRRARSRSDYFPYYEGIITNKWLEIIVYHSKLNSVTTKLGLITLCFSHL